MMSEYVVKLVTFIYLFIFRQLFYVNLFFFYVLIFIISKIYSLY